MTRQIHRSLMGALLIGLTMLTASADALVKRQIDHDFPGPYCAQLSRTCCDHRQDTCSFPISNTLCYCDEFCERGNHGDCCPDYEPYCLNKTIAPPPLRSCLHNGIYFSVYDLPIQDNCNLCHCKENGYTECEQNTCLVDPQLIARVNSHSSSLGWSARNYTEFWGRKFSEGLKLRLGTNEPKNRVKQMTRITNKLDLEKLAKNFNSINHWPNGFISNIVDQGWCGSSWAISTTSVASDRYAVLSKGKEIVKLAPQQMLSCVRNQQGCSGGHLDRAWNYIRRVGLVDEDCYPYIMGVNRCKVSRRDNLKSLMCISPLERSELYKMGPAYSLRNETDIMLEIAHSGPVQATMRVYRDFFSYSGGIYRHAADNNNERGFHSVKIVGWGEEVIGYSSRPTKFWIAANSWGTWWGENGYFRIARGDNECDIEDYVLASWAHVHTNKKARAGRGQSGQLRMG